MGFPELKSAGYEELFDLPENLLGEIVNGRLVTHPRPAPRHALAYSVLGASEMACGGWVTHGAHRHCC